MAMRLFEGQFTPSEGHLASCKGFVREPCTLLFVALHGSEPSLLFEGPLGGLREALAF